MGSQPGSRLTWLLWMLVCVQVLLMVVADSTPASRAVQHERTPELRRLQPFNDDSNAPRHAPPVKTILVSDGTAADCIPIEGQISAHHPALKDHVVPMRPSVSVARRMITLHDQAARSSEVSHPQQFAREHGGCPEGSIPVLRADLHRPLLRKTRIPRHYPGEHYTREEEGATHEYAVTGLRYSPHSYSGASSVLSVNGPKIGVLKEDFSLSQVWIVDRTLDDSDAKLSTIEAGWQTFPSYPGPYPNTLRPQPLAPHLFIFWTGNNYGNGSCYNLECAGFVQVSNTWLIGGAMPHYTTLTQHVNLEYEVKIGVYYDSFYRVWWLYLNYEAVGYWPSRIYADERLHGSANVVQWGGEVFYVKDNTTIQHSQTAMGSGAFPGAGYPAAAYHRNISFANATGTAFIRPTRALLEHEKYVDDALCYDLAVQQGNFSNWGTHFFFGGPGGNNPGCVSRM